MEQRRQDLPTNAAAADPRDSGRSFVDPTTRVTWRVTESPPGTLPGHEGAPCLLFVTETKIRRVWTYPAGWRDLSAEELAALSWGT